MPTVVGTSDEALASQQDGDNPVGNMKATSEPCTGKNHRKFGEWCAIACIMNATWMDAN